MTNEQTTPSPELSDFIQPRYRQIRRELIEAVEGAKNGRCSYPQIVDATQLMPGDTLALLSGLESPRKIDGVIKEILFDPKGDKPDVTIVFTEALRFPSGNDIQEMSGLAIGLGPLNPTGQDNEGRIGYDMSPYCHSFLADFTEM
jgi:hypothetical protein